MDYCDSCQEIRELKYCEETDNYHCEECQDETLQYRDHETHGIPVTGKILETLAPAKCKCPWSLQAGCQWSKGNGKANSKTELSTCWNKEDCDYKVTSRNASR